MGDFVCTMAEFVQRWVPNTTSSLISEMNEKQHEMYEDLRVNVVNTLIYYHSAMMRDRLCAGCLERSRIDLGMKAHIAQLKELGKITEEDVERIRTELGWEKGADR